MTKPGNKLAGLRADTKEALGFRPVWAVAPRGHSKTLGGFEPLPELKILGSCTLQSRGLLKIPRAKNH